MFVCWLESEPESTSLGFFLTELWVQLQLGILASAHYLFLITKLSSQTKGFPNSDASLSDFKCHSAHWFWQDDQLYWRECVCSVTQLHPTLCDPIDCSPPGSSVGFSRQEYWSGLPFPSPGNPPDQGIEHRSPALQADSLPTELLDLTQTKCWWWYRGTGVFI